MGVELSAVLGVLAMLRRDDGKPLRRTVSPDGDALYSMEYCRRWNASNPFDDDELKLIWCAVLNLPRLLRCRGSRRYLASLERRERRMASGSGTPPASPRSNS